MLSIQKGKINIRSKSGFTLLEMIVSMGIFTIVAVIAVGSLVRITSLNRQAQAMQAAMNNINYILESMSREMRFGYKYHCLDGDLYNGGQISFQECGAGDDKAILFESTKFGPNNACRLVYAYWFINDNGKWSINKSQQTACNQSLNRDDSWPMIDPGNVTVTNIDIDVRAGNLGYAMFAIDMTGYSGAKENERSDFRIKTAVSQRIRD